MNRKLAKRSSRRILVRGSLGFLGLIVLLTILAPLLPLPSPYTLGLPFQSPSMSHILGTDNLGRDVLSRLIFGAQASLEVAVGSLLVAAVFGVTIGLIGSAVRQWIGDIVLRLVDIVLSFPTIILVILVTTLVGTGIPTLIAVLGILFMPAFARLAYAESLRVRRATFVRAAQMAGLRRRTILSREILPNVVPILFVQCGLTVAASVLTESGLDYLGLGVTAPRPSWGGMIRDASDNMLGHPNGLIAPIIVLVLTVMAVMVLVDEAQRRTDPRRKRMGERSDGTSGAQGGEVFAALATSVGVKADRLIGGGS